MKQANRKLLVLVLALSLVAAGCGSSNDNNEAQPEDKGDQTKTSDQTNTNTNQPDQNDQPAGTDDAEVMGEFEKLTAGGAPSSELLNFIASHHKQAQPESVTAMLVALEKAQHEQSVALEERFYNESGLQEKMLELFTEDFKLPKAEEVKDEALKKLLQDTEAGGYKVETAEGTFFPVIDYERYRQFQPSVTADMKAYIDIMAVESNEPAMKDAGLVIEWDEVIERALTMEAFLRDYPDSAKRADMEQLFNGYQYITLQGVDNSPLFDYENKTILPEVKTAFTTATSGGIEQSEYLGKIKQLLELVEKNGGKQTDEVSKLQEKMTAGLLGE